MSTSERETIRLLTLTRLWLFSRYLYRIGEWRLMVPLSHRALGYGLAVFVPVWIVLQWANVSTASAVGMFVYGAIPAGIVWWALHLVGEGARPHELVTSWARYGRAVVLGRRLTPVRVGSRSRADLGRPARMREH